MADIKRRQPFRTSATSNNVTDTRLYRGKEYKSSSTVSVKIQMMLNHELSLFNNGVNLIAGVDEVGRGCLAGPMVIGAVILNPKHLRMINNDVESVNDLVETLKLYSDIKDSKKLTAKKRKELSDFIKIHALSYSFEIIQNHQLDEWGITKSTQIGFFNAIKNLKQKPDHVLTDAFKINALPEVYQTNIISGDAQSITIAAASIIAKVFRDELMTELHNTREIYRIYRFDEHKGYGTKNHLKVIHDYGICDLHRKSFEPIKSMI